MRKDGRAAASAMYEGKRITRYGRTKTEARQKLDAYLADLRAGKIVLGPKQTVAQYLTHWLEDSYRLQLRVSSVQKYRGLLKNHLIPAFGHLRLSDLTRQHVQSFYARKLGEGLSPRTIKVIHVLLSGALKEAVRDGLLAQNVCEYVTLPRVGVYEAHPFTQEECQRLIEATRGHWLWPFLLVAVTTGARRGELLALRWDDVDLVTGVVRIHRTVGRLTGLGYVENETKTVSGMRSVNLPRVAIDALCEQRKYVDCLSRSAYWNDRGLVFPGRFGNYMDDSHLLKRFKVLLAQAGLPVVRLHDLRHSAATLLLAAGVNVKVVQELLGHSSISVTLGMYGHVLPNMQREVKDKMDDMFGRRL